jgi:hypothetical protein
MGVVQRRGKAYIEHLRQSGLHILEVQDSNQVLLNDDHLVAGSAGVEPCLVQPDKHPANPVVRPEHPWEGHLGYVAAMYDEEEQLFKMWYQSRHQDDLPRTCYAVSADAIHWDKPELGLHEFDGSSANNICYQSPAPPRGRGASNHVFKDYADPDPQRLYKMVVDLIDFRGRGIALIHSPDGIHWSDPGYTVLQGGFDTQNVVLWDDQQGCFRAYLRWWQYGLRHIRMATSYDLYHWSKPICILGPDEDDPELFDLYTSGAVKYAAAPDVFIMQPAAFDHTTDRLWGELALSRDGETWTRSREPCLALGGEDAWDRGSIYPAPLAAPVGDRVYLLYRGEETGHGGSLRGPGIGLATLRRDGFVAWRAGPSGGTLRTHLLAYSHGGGDLPGRGRLRLNIRADGGEARVELRDLDGKAIPGFAAADCDPVTADSISHAVSWGGSPVLDRLHGLPFSMCVHLRDAELYSFCFRRRGGGTGELEQQIAAREQQLKAVPPGAQREGLRTSMQEFVDGLRQAANK